MHVICSGESVIEYSLISYGIGLNIWAFPIQQTQAPPFVDIEEGTNKQFEKDYTELIWKEYPIL